MDSDFLADSSAVLALQKQLNQLGYDLAQDGVFGPKTEEAVLDAMRRYGFNSPNEPISQVPARSKSKVTYWLWVLGASIATVFFFRRFKKSK